MAFKRILIAVNDEQYAREVTRVACELAFSLQAKLAMVYVVDQRLLIQPPDQELQLLDTLALMREEGTRVLDTLSRRYAPESPVERFLPEGSPSKEILRVADEWKADLIVLGTHGRSGLLQLISGSISTYVKHHAPVPVLIVPSQHPAG